MVIVSGVSRNALVLSVSRAVNEIVPAFCGFPLTSLVVELICNPPGRAPAEIVQLKGPTPPVKKKPAS